MCGFQIVKLVGIYWLRIFTVWYLNSLESLEVINWSENDQNFFPHSLVLNHCVTLHPE